MTAFAKTAGPISDRRLIEFLSLMEDQERPVSVALFERSGQFTIQAASNAVIIQAALGVIELAKSPVILIVAGNPPDGFVGRAQL